MRAILPFSLCMLLSVAVSPAASRVNPVGAGQLSVNNVTCEQPVRLTRDCTIRRGANRAIRLGGVSMAVAADRDGDTLLLAARDPRAALHRVADELEARGIQLRRAEALVGRRGVSGFLLHFDGDAYRHLQAFTVLDPVAW
jgi:hypothetical protein